MDNMTRINSKIKINKYYTDKEDSKTNFHHLGNDLHAFKELLPRSADRN